MSLTCILLLISVATAPDSSISSSSTQGLFLDKPKLERARSADLHGLYHSYNPYAFARRPISSVIESSQEKLSLEKFSLSPSLSLSAYNLYRECRECVERV
jgi:hypothetical protein